MADFTLSLLLICNARRFCLVLVCCKSNMLSTELSLTEVQGSRCHLARTLRVRIRDL